MKRDAGICGRNWKMSVVAGVVMLGLFTCGACAADLLSWNFSNLTGGDASKGTAASVASSSNNANMQASTITRGAEMAAGWQWEPSPLATYGTTVKPVLNNHHELVEDLNAAITAGAYFQFVATPANGCRMSLKTVDIVAYIQHGGDANKKTAGKLCVKYSLDGFTTAGTSVGTELGPFEKDSWVGSKFIIDLGGEAALQNVTKPVTFRIYLYQVPKCQDRGLGWGNAAESEGDVLKLQGTAEPAK